MSRPSRTIARSSSTRASSVGRPSRARTSVADPGEGRSAGPGGRPEGTAGVPHSGQGGTQRSGTFVGLVAVVSVLTVMGLVMVLSSSSVQAIRQFGSPWVYFERQVLWVAVGVAVLVVCAKLDYRVWRRF